MNIKLNREVNMNTKLILEVNMNTEQNVGPYKLAFHGQIPEQPKTRIQIASFKNPSPNVDLAIQAQGRCNAYPNDINVVTKDKIGH